MLLVDISENEMHFNQVLLAAIHFFSIYSAFALDCKILVSIYHLPQCQSTILFGDNFLYSRF